MSFTASLEQVIGEDRSGLLETHPTWERVELAQVASILNGFAFRSSHFSRDEGVPLLRIRDVTKDSTEARYNGEFDSKYLVERDQLVVGMDGDFNSALWSGPTALLNQRVCRIDPDERFYDKRFLSYALPGYLAAIHSRTSSVTVKHLSSKTVAKIPLPLPPLEEQRQIVAELEKHFTRLDAAVAALKRAQANLERYRASILQEACEGRLVPTEHTLAALEKRSYEPAKVFLARVIGFEEPRETEHPQHPPGWAWVRLRDIAQIQGGLAKGKRRKSGIRTEPVPYLRVANVQRGFLDLSDVREIQATRGEIEQLRLREGDLLFTEGGDRDKLGRGWIWSNEVESCIHQNHIFRARLLTEAISPKFVSWYANTMGRTYFEQQGKQTTNLASISLSKLRDLPLAIPPEREQKRIVVELERQLSILDQVSLEIEGELGRAAALRKAILKRAFEGKLVPQDPTDEPASVLLERIRQEREAIGAPAKGRSHRTRSSTGRRTVKHG